MACNLNEIPTSNSLSDIIRGQLFFHVKCNHDFIHLLLDGIPPVSSSSVLVNLQRFWNTLGHSYPKFVRRSPLSAFHFPNNMVSGS